MAKLKEYGKIITGNTPPSSNPDYYNSDDICFVKPSDIASDIVTNITDSEYYISEDARACSRIIPAGSILVTCIGTVGKIGITQKEVAFNQQINAIVPNNKVDTTCLAYALLFHSDRIKAIANAPVVPIINKSTFSEIDIPLPDLPTQRRIAATLDKVSEGIAVCRKMMADLDTLIKARFVEMFGSLKDEQLLGDMSEFVTVGIANSATHAYAESGIPMLRNQNIKENHLDDSDLIYIKPEFAARYESKKLRENDIIAMRTGYPGVACLVPKKYEGCQTFTTLIIRLKAGNNPSYVCSYINSDLGKRFIDSEKVGVAQQNVGAKSLAKMPIKVAPKGLQDEYAVFIQQVDKSKFVVQKQLTELETLKKSLMQEYFG